MKDWLPEGYQPHEIPPDYSLPLFLEYQMGYAFEQGFGVAQKYMIELEKENSRLNAEIERLQAEVEQYRQEWIDRSIKLENLNAA